MDDSSNICLACGLCCDGTLIGFVQLEPKEIPAIAELMEIENDHGNGLFLQPCAKYCDGCTIYSSRPKQCASFKCGLLKSVEQKEVKFDSAVDITEKVKEKKLAIESRLGDLGLELESNSFYFKMVELKKVIQSISIDPTIEQSYIELKSELKELDNLLLEKFDITLD